MNITHRRTLLGAVVAAMLVVTGCQGIPVEGPVLRGLTDLSQAQQQVQYRPDMPMPEASREEIVRGFLQAASSATDDYAIARQFLTRDYEQQWDPYQTVIVDEGPRQYQEVAEGATSLFTLHGVAWIDERGILTQIQPDESTEVSFEVEEEDGEWRISSAPNGIILDRTTFLDVWSQHELFFGTSSEQLVSDGRWFLNRATMSTQIVSELLAGPSPLLEGVARNGFAPGTRLASDAVLIDAGTARIDLTDGFEDLPPSAIALAEQQLGTSLNSVPGVTSFVVSVDHVEIMSGTVMAPQSLETTETLEAGYRAMLWHDGQLGNASADGFRVTTALTENLTGLAPTAITMDPLQQSAAVLTAGGVWWVTPRDSTLIDERRDLLPPTVDRHDYIWTATETDPGLITVQRPGDEPLTLEAPWLDDLNVTAMRVSPGGQKFAVLVSTDRGTEVLVSGITREATGVPTGIIDPAGQVSFWVQGSPIDLDWVDSMRVVALTKTDSTTKLTIGGPGMFAEERNGVAGAVAVRGGGRSALIQLRNTNGDLWAPQGTTGWQRQFADVDILTKRG